MKFKLKPHHRNVSDKELLEELKRIAKERNGMWRKALEAIKDVIFSVKDFIENPTQDNFLKMILIMRKDLSGERGDLNLSKIKITLCTLFLIFFSLTSSFAQLGGTSTYNFLELPVSARSAALGDNFIAVRDGDLSLAAENPSFLDSTLNNHLALSFIPFFDDITYSFASYARSYSGIGTFDAGIKYIDYGSFPQTDLAGNIIGNFSASEYMLFIGYGRQLKDTSFSVGINIKAINSVLYQYNSWGLAVDLGVSYISPDHQLWLGAVMENFGTQLKDYVTGNSEPLPFDAEFGAAYKFEHAPFRLCLSLRHLQVWNLAYTDPTDTETVNPLTGQKVAPSANGSFFDNLARHAIPGLEIVLSRNFFIRFAYNYQLRQEMAYSSEPGIAGLSGGFELKIYKLHLSYALAKYNLIGSSNTFTLVTNLSDYYSRRN